MLIVFEEINRPILRHIKSKCKAFQKTNNILKNHTLKNNQLKSFNSQYFNNAERSKKKKDRKNKWQQKKDFNTPASGVKKELTKNNNDKHSKKEKRRAPKKDLSKIICYNYDKKGHYLNKCLELSKMTQKTSISLGNLLIGYWY